MSTDRDTTRIVRSWLRTDEHESADNVLDNVLALLDATPQRRPPWPARRIADMNSFAKLAMVAAAVVVAGVVGVNLLLPGNRGGGGPLASASPPPTVPPSPSPSAAAFPPEGDLAGRHTIKQNGVVFTLEFPRFGWFSRGISVPPDGVWIEKGPMGLASSVWMPIWSIDGVYADPCAGVAAPPVSPSAADLAAAVAGLPGVEVGTEPEDVTLGGRPATHVVITVPEGIDCDPRDYMMWYDDVECDGVRPCGRFVSALGQRNEIWIIEVDDTHVWIEAETYEGGTPGLGDEIRQIIDSIQFE